MSAIGRVPSRPPRLQFVLLAGVSAVMAFRIWTSFCFFPFTEWNSVRLAPTFMLWFGPTPYPSLASGPLTTWIYGPVALLLNLPAVLAHDPITALYLAGTINVLGAVVPAAVAVFALAEPRTETPRTDRLWALLLCLALWPNSSLQYIQADNAAIAFGLLSNVLLVRGRDGNRVLLPLAALCAALAVWSKQTSIGLLAGQTLWLAIVVGRKSAVRYAALGAGCALALGAAFVAWFGADELWLNLVRIPGRLPFCESVAAYTRDFWMQISGYVLLPTLGAIVARRALCQRDSPWLLPMLTWLCLLPTALVSIYKVGGATNSLNCVLYLLPSAALTLVVALRRLTPRASQAWLAAGILAVLIQQMSFSSLLPLRPLTAHLEEAEQLAREYPGRIYFPWHPLVTFFSDHRFYHAEDGLYTRQIAGLGRDRSTASRDLPPQWSITAIPGWRSQGVFKPLQPPAAQLGFVGKWAVYAWPVGRPPNPPP